MCFAPQRRALFRHLNLQKWPGHVVFCTFSLGNVLRATTACTFSTSQLPKVVRPWCVLYIFTSKCASRHNGVQFFISNLASWLRTRRFSEPTFRPSGAQNHWKSGFSTFSRICIFFLLTLSLLLFFLLIFLFSLPLPCSAFHLSILSEVWLLNFLRLMVPWITSGYAEITFFPNILMLKPAFSTILGGEIQFFTRIHRGFPFRSLGLAHAWTRPSHWRRDLWKGLFWGAMKAINWGWVKLPCTPFLHMKLAGSCGCSSP